MIYTIEWTDRSHEQLMNLVRTIDERWGGKVVTSLISQLKFFLNVIEEMPEAFPVINTRMQWRRCVITKGTVIFYKILDNTIVIPGIYDTRMDPDRFMN